MGGIFNQARACPRSRPRPLRVLERQLPAYAAHARAADPDLALGIALQIIVLGQLLVIALGGLYAASAGARVFRYAGF
jgi:hypothetical protein